MPPPPGASIESASSAGSRATAADPDDRRPSKQRPWGFVVTPSSGGSEPPGTQVDAETSPAGPSTWQLPPAAVPARWPAATDQSSKTRLWPEVLVDLAAFVIAKIIGWPKLLKGSGGVPDRRSGYITVVGSRQRGIRSGHLQLDFRAQAVT